MLLMAGGGCSLGTCLSTDNYRLHALCKFIWTRDSGIRAFLALLLVVCRVLASSVLTQFLLYSTCQTYTCNKLRKNWRWERCGGS